MDSLPKHSTPSAMARPLLSQSSSQNTTRSLGDSLKLHGNQVIVSMVNLLQIKMLSYSHSPTILNTTSDNQIHIELYRIIKTT